MPHGMPQTMSPPLTRLRRAAAIIIIVCLTALPGVVGAQAPQVVVIEMPGLPDNMSPNRIARLWQARFETAPALTLPSHVVTHRISDSAFDQLNARFNEAQELFFSGNFESCLNALRALHDIIEKSMPSATHQKALRTMDRDTLLYAALVTKNTSAGIEAYQKHLNRVATRYGDIPLDNRDFPPWLRSELTSAIQQQKKNDVAVQFTVPKDCHLLLDGVRKQNRDTRLSVSKGHHTFKIICANGAESLMSTQHIQGNQATLQPVFVENLKISIQDNVVVLSPMTRAPFNITSAVPVLQELMQQMNLDKTMVLLREKNGVTAALIDVHAGLQSASGIGDTPTPTDNQLTSLFKNLLNGRHNLTAGMRPAPVYPQSRLKRPVPWILLSSGIALAVTGFAMGAHYGSPSRQEPFIWALQLTGATLCATGVVFFILPAWQYTEQAQFIGIQTGVTF